MASFATLNEHLGILRGDVLAAVQVGRYGRNQGFLGRSSKSADAPDIESQHAVFAALMNAYPGPQVGAPGIAQVQWGYRHTKGKPALAVRGKAVFGEICTSVLSWYAGDSSPGDAFGAGRAPGVFKGIKLWYDQPLAAILIGNDEWYFGAPKGTWSSQVSAFSTVTRIDQVAFEKLGGLVRQSRDEAARRGVTIDTKQFYQALRGKSQTPVKKIRGGGSSSQDEPDTGEFLGSPVSSRMSARSRDERCETSDTHTANIQPRKLEGMSVSEESQYVLRDLTGDNPVAQRAA